MPSDETIRAGLDRLARSAPEAASEADLFLATDRGQRRRRSRRLRIGVLAAAVLIAAASVAAVAWPAQEPGLETADGIDASTSTTPTTDPPLSTTTWIAPADDPTQPSPAALEADRSVRAVPPALFACGTAVTTSGYPTTSVAPLDLLDCIVDAAATGSPAQFTFTGRNFTGGMAGTIYRVDVDGSLSTIDYEVDLAGIVVDETTTSCAEFRASGPFPDIVCVPFPDGGPAGTDGAPTEAALAADEAMRDVPAGYDSCGTIDLAAGWPTTIPVSVDATTCIIGTFNENVRAQYSVTGRDFAGGMAGTVIRVEGDGTITYIDYTASPEGNVGTTTQTCTGFVLQENSPVPGCLD